MIRVCLTYSSVKKFGFSLVGAKFVEDQVVLWWCSFFFFCGLGWGLVVCVSEVEWVAEERKVHNL